MGHVRRVTQGEHGGPSKVGVEDANRSDGMNGQRGGAPGQDRGWPGAPARWLWRCWASGAARAGGGAQVPK